MKLSQIETPEDRARQRLYRLGGYDFHRMRLYLNEMRNLMRNQSIRINLEHKSQLKKYPQQAQMIDEVYFRKQDDNDNNFVGYLFNSALVASASIFESTIKNVCEFAAYKTHRKFQEQKQRVIEHCRSFIKGVGVNLEEIDEHWKTIEMSLRVRHLVTHAGATFPYEKNVYEPEQKELIQHIKGSKYIRIKRPRSKGPKQFLIKNQLYVIEFLDITQDYLLWIIMQLPERRRKKSKVRKIRSNLAAVSK